MSTVNNTNFSQQGLGYLGHNFQMKLLSELTIPNNINKQTGNNFFDEIIDLLDPNYFESLDMRRLMSMIKEYHQKNKNIPNLDNLLTLVSTDINNEVDKEEAKARVNKILELRKKYKSGEINNDRDFIKTKTLTFIKQQEFLKINKEASERLNAGIVDENTIFNLSEKYKKILDIGSPMNYGTDIYDNPEEILAEDFRKPIGIGVKEIDERLNGGLDEGEWALILAGQGVGKSSVLTLIANNAYTSGHNVLHVIMEGKSKDIRRKHYSKLFKIKAEDFPKNREKILKNIEKLKSNTKYGTLRVEKLPDDTTPNKFRKWAKKIQEKLGYKFDVICFDYIDCLMPDDKGIDKFYGQELVAKSIDNICDSEGWRMYVGIQAKKESNGKRILEMGDCGGSVERLKKAQLVIALGRDQSELDNNEVNISVIKCRFARSGALWEKCQFNNDILDLKVSREISEYEINPNIIDFSEQEGIIPPPMEDLNPIDEIKKDSIKNIAEPIVEKKVDAIIEASRNKINNLEF